MASLLFIMCIVAMVAMLIYDFQRNRRRVDLLNHTINSLKDELTQATAQGGALKNEILTLEKKVRQSVEDPITGLASWQVFEDRLNQNIKESARYNLTMGILFIDIDDFKVINDALGYAVGDSVLHEMGQRLLTCIRQVDSISRFTKDTFVILLSQLIKPETAAVVAQRILKTMAEPFQVNEKELYITVSIGVTIYPIDGQTSAALLRSADHALHLAKEKGKHTYQFYQERMHAKSQRELTLYNSLSREAIFDEFVLYYQPIVNVEDESIFCMDALLHWEQPHLGLIKPQELLTLAERQRKLNLISEWVLRMACRRFLHWRSIGFNPRFLGIVLCIHQLETYQFIYRISQILQELQFNPASLLLEIKDASLETASEGLEKAFNMLKYLGISIAIDEFGGVAFSLRYLKDFTFNYLKLDASLTADVIQNEKATALIKALLFLGQCLSLQVIAQGIESDQQKNKLRELGCLLMQGQLLGAPITEQEIAAKNK